jgi:uncharacterized membrane protein YccF (DUF307 family)
MKVHTNGLWMRICGSATGLGYLAVGTFAIAKRSEAPDPMLADRALWMGITFLLAGGLAIGVSWLVADLSNIW